jgi:hypothetical protein
MYDRSAASAAGTSLMPTGTGSTVVARTCAVVAGGRSVNSSSCRLQRCGGGPGWRNRGDVPNRFVAEYISP